MMLVVLFLLNIDILYQLTSSLNLEPLLCDKKTLSDYENQMPIDLSQDVVEKYQVCANESYLFGWLLVVPLTAFQVYCLHQFV